MCVGVCGRTEAVHGGPLHEARVRAAGYGACGGCSPVCAIVGGETLVSFEMKSGVWVPFYEGSSGGAGQAAAVCMLYS